MVEDNSYPVASWNSFPKMDQLLSRACFFKLLCSFSFTESWKSSKSGLVCHGWGVSRGQVLKAQHEDSRRLRYFGFPSSEHCLRRFWVQESQEEAVGNRDQRAVALWVKFCNWASGSEGQNCLCFVPHYSWNHQSLLGAKLSFHTSTLWTRFLGSEVLPNDNH